MAESSPLALITGASRGIGFELARLCARDGFDLVVAADDPDIGRAAESLSSLGIHAQPVCVDLADPDQTDHLYRTATRGGREIAIAALNAGTGRAGAFVGADIAQDLRIVDVNVRSTVQLAKLVLDGMAVRGAGRVLFTSSLVATMPGSYQSMYNASKSFIQSFVEALHEELRDSEISVTALMPGVTDTDFFRRNGMLDTPLGRVPVKDDPAKTARQGYEAMMRGQRKVVASSPISKMTAAAMSVLPDSVKAVANRLLVAPPGNR
jgi:short-subunit dehydrogenase